MNEQVAYDATKRAIQDALEEIKNKMPELYHHLRESIKMDENTKTFGYFPNEK